jgi:hypothetical protein
MKQYNGEKYIVSFTSFGPRIESACKMVFAMTKQTYKDFHLVMTLYKDDIKYISDTMQLLLDNDVLELLIADVDLGPHCKYYYAMKKYYDKPIITVDDDRRYGSDTLEKLITKFESVEYKTIISNCAIKMQKTNKGILPYSKWCPFRLKPHEKSYLAMAEGFAGILYPPKCFDNLLSSEWVNCISDCKYDDDLYLKIQGIKNKIPVTQSTHIQGCAEVDNIKESMPYNLHNNQNKGDTPRNNLCYKHAAELLKGWEL